MPPTMTRLFIRYLPKGAKFQAAAKFSMPLPWPPGRRVGRDLRADLNAVSTIQMIGTSVRPSPSGSRR